MAIKLYKPTSPGRRFRTGFDFAEITRDTPEPSPIAHEILQGGRAFAIEVKRPGGRANERQEQFLERIRAAGGIAGCATSVEQAIAIIAPPA